MVASEPPLIAHVIFRLDVGGLENGIVNLVNHIPGQRYRQAIICLKDYTEFRNRIHSPGIPIIALGKKEGKDLDIYRRLWTALRRMRPDIVHTRNLGTIDAAIPAALAGVRHRIHGEHGWDMPDLYGDNPKYRILRRFCHLFIGRHITVSMDLANWLHGQIGVPMEKIVQIYNGVDVEKFSPPPAGRSELLNKNFAMSDSLVIGMVGRMAAVKNPMALVRAFLHLLETVGGGRKKLRLVMIGDGPLKAEMYGALAAANALDLVWMPGERDDIPNILRGIDVFVMPSLNEGISNTILEAMATGLPVVATDVGGNPELVKSGRTGYLVKAGDIEALANGIRNYLDNPAWISQHGNAGRREAESHFSLQSMVHQYLAVYDSVLGVLGPARPG